MRSAFLLALLTLLTLLTTLPVSSAGLDDCPELRVREAWPMRSLAPVDAFGDAWISANPDPLCEGGERTIRSPALAADFNRNEPGLHVEAVLVGDGLDPTPHPLRTFVGTDLVTGETRTWYSSDAIPLPDGYTGRFALTLLLDGVAVASVPLRAGA